MTIQTRAASSVVSATFYTGGANTYTSNDAYATWTSTSRNQTAQLILGIAAFDIPAGATINSVTVYVERKWSSGASSLIDYAYAQASNSGTLRGTQYNDTTFPTTDTAFSTDGGTWTVSELSAGTMQVRFDSDRKNTTSQTIHYLDDVYVEVDYTTATINYKTATTTSFLSATARRQTQNVLTASTSLAASVRRVVNRSITTVTDIIGMSIKASSRGISGIVKATGNYLTRFNGYVIERKDGDGEWFILTRVSAGTSGYTDCYNLVGGITYYYRIKRVSLILSDSDWSNIESYFYEETAATLKSLSAGITITMAAHRQTGRTLMQMVDITQIVQRTTKAIKIGSVGLTATLFHSIVRYLVTASRTGGQILRENMKRLISLAIVTSMIHRIETVLKMIETIIVIAPGLTRQTLRSFITSGAINGIMTRSFTTFKMIATSLDTTGQILRRTMKGFLGSMIVTSTINRLKAVLKAITATISSVEILIRQTTQSLASSITISSATAQSLTTIKMIVVNIPATVQNLRHIAKRLTGSVTIFSITSRMKAALKSMTTQINSTISVRRRIIRSLKPVIDTVSATGRHTSRLFRVTISAFSEIIRQNNKRITGSATVTLTIVRMKVALKTLIASIMTTVIIRTEIIRTLTSAVNAVNMARLLTARTFAAAISTLDKILSQSIKRLTSSMNVTSTMTRIKVSVKDLIVSITTLGLSKRMMMRTIVLALSTVSTIQKEIARSFTSALIILSMVLRQIEKLLEVSVHILVSVAHSSVIMRTYIATTRTASAARRVTIKTALAGANIAGSICRQTFKLISDVASTTAQITRVIAREIRSDLDAIESTFRITARDVRAAVSASTIGSDIHRIVVMVYYKTLTAATNAAVAIKRHISRILMALISAASSRESAKCHAETVIRTATLSTTNRALILSIRDQEGDPLAMAYTGDTIRLYGRFYNWTDILADVTSPEVVIYDGKRNQIIAGIPTKESTGVYYYEYLIPSSYSDPLIFEMSGILEGSTILARSTIERRWV
ncbi:hypothetical protein SAMN03080599_02252 [Acidaminobacter hydrogenoformans DSM 2784]|uniref:Uncharacterized protein n=2 Tax=Acidaminobacter TaxID=65402 RepID=A0A1G5S3Q8_9FIRM|nr:hypothetical protein SAMN03080599_02252 [Acidaminobacter hydrogenoformans DSM 2784]